MKAVSIKQPWASLIAHGIKDIENRTWKTKFRGKIYIHASVKSAGNTAYLLNKEQDNFFAYNTENYKTFESNLPYSAIIGEVDIIDCVINHPSIWAEKTFMYEYDEESGEKPIGKPIYNWVLANPVLYDKPILNVKGKLSFWDFLPCKTVIMKFRNIKNSDDFNDVASDMLSEFLSNITTYGIYTKEADGDFPLLEFEENIGWYYNQKGMILIERWHERMKVIYEKYFDDNDFNPKSTYYKEF